MNFKNKLIYQIVKLKEKYVSSSVIEFLLRFVIKFLNSKFQCCLPSNSNYLSSKLIAEKQTVIRHDKRRIIVLDKTDSTNNVAKNLAVNGAAHGTVVIANYQSAGKGRIGRNFVSPSCKGLYMSVIIRPNFFENFATLITVYSAVVVAEAVEQLCGCKVGIKWINDIYMNGRKICGILTESSIRLEKQQQVLDYAVIGIGINVYSYDFGDELKELVTTIEDETGKQLDRNILCATVLERLDSCVYQIKSGEFLKKYRHREILTGNRITASVGNDSIEALVIGIDDNANLVIQLNDGTKRILSSGEVNLCRFLKK